MKYYALILSPLFLLGAGEPATTGRQAQTMPIQYYQNNQYLDPYYLEQRIAWLEYRVCQLEYKLDPVEFSYPANGVIMQRSGRIPRPC